MPSSFTLYLPNSVDPAAVASSIEIFGVEVEKCVDDSSIRFRSLSSSDRATISFPTNRLDYIRDAAEWDWNSSTTRSLLEGAIVLSVDYTCESLARRVLFALIDILGAEARRSVLDNDLGVLLVLSDVKEQLLRNQQWSWRKESFPEIPGNPKVE